ncbi:hypothetical protein, partial [Herbaspirillum sp.]|uniref:hypothetical protein n=1 Tax=Herbaspirillum sp. TaxID=1890675 RepID=UPI0025879309
MWHTYLHYLLHKASKELKKKVWPILFESAEPKRIAEAKLLRKRLVTAQQKSAKEKTSMTTKKKAAKKPAAKKPAAKKPAAKKPAAKKPAAKKPAAKKPAAKKPAAKKPAAKKPAAKKPAAKKPATEKKDGVGTYVRQLLVDGETSRAVILEKAQSKYPESNILGKDVSWYAWKLKKEGKKIKGLIRETKKASK